ncbi:MAG: glycosyl hydrolase, partial [Armatimonadetes bacterium]|nr:glycosyl hydrolase [Armatimonadota bacterium]
ASPGPWQAHTARDAESLVYRRTGRDPWEPVLDGLPDPGGTTRFVLAFHPAEPGVAYAANNQGIYRSADAGFTWERLDIPWPARYRSQRVEGLAVIENG